jgi:DNA repair protein RecN (Recombination protein N)
MLTHIQIENFTIIVKLDLELQTGLNVITGETGSGKSVILDALELAMGARADSNLVRYGSERCDISVHFSCDKSVQCWLQQHELNADQDCILRRTLTADGRSKAYINGYLVPVQKLKALANLLVDIHGQHESQNLLRVAAQRDLLDGYGQHQALITQVMRLAKDIADVTQSLLMLKQQADRYATEQQFLQFQLKELEDLAVTETEYADIEQEHRCLAKADMQLVALQQLVVLLDESHEQPLLKQIARCIQILNPLIQQDNQLADIQDLFQTASIQLQEAKLQIDHYLYQFERDPQRLIWLETRLDQIHKIARKYRIEAKNIFYFYQDIQQKLQHNLTYDEQINTLQKQLDLLQQEYLQQANALSSRRQQAAVKLAQEVEKIIRQLGMPQAQFAIEFNPVATNVFSAHGLETVQFNVSANPGQPLQALQKVVSGGELSRISLAIQVVTAHVHTMPCLIFDEVDVGIGGSTAEIVGQLLRNLSSHAQIICITHLAQVAAQGHYHYRVEKHIDRDSTSTTTSLLTDEQRVLEIARMLGGVNLTEQTVNHAREMLNYVLATS